MIEGREIHGCQHHSLYTATNESRKTSFWAVFALVSNPSITAPAGRPGRVRIDQKAQQQFWRAGRTFSAALNFPRSSVDASASEVIRYKWKCREYARKSARVGLDNDAM